MVHQVGDVVDQDGELADVAVIKYAGKQITGTGQHLQAVAETDQSVVAWVGGQLIPIHDVHARGRHSQVTTKESF